MSDSGHVEILRQGPEAWNAWRASNPDVTPSLAGADLEESSLADANLSGADLSGADLFQADLRRANLKMADLSGADLSNAQLAGADLYKAELTGTSLLQADLQSAYLAGSKLAEVDARGADLSGADLSEVIFDRASLVDARLVGCNLNAASIVEADMSRADLSDTSLVELKYGSFRSMSGHYRAIRGLHSAHGNRLFVRDAEDQDYLDTLSRRIDRTPSTGLRTLKQGLFKAWGWIDYGRSLGLPAIYAMCLAATFGLIFLADMKLGWGLMDYSGSSQSLFTPFYYSLVTYTTLGFGDITPKHWVGEIIVVIEVLLGYLTLSLLVSILANTVARRS